MRAGFVTRQVFGALIQGMQCLMKTPSQRQLKVGEELRHVLAWALERGEVRDPAVAGTPLTVTEVAVSPDLKNATAYVVPLGVVIGEIGGDFKDILVGLDRAAPFLRRYVASRVRLRFAPKLSFAADTAYDNSEHIERLLRRPDVARDLEEVIDGEHKTGPEKKN